MKFMAEEARNMNVPGPSTKPSEYTVNKYGTIEKYRVLVLSLSNNSRSESFTWQTHVTCVARNKKHKRDRISCS